MRSLAIPLSLLVVGCGGGNDGAAGGKDGGVVDAPISLEPDASTSGGVDGGSTGMVNDAGQPLCQSSTGLVVCQCSDGLDNDHDGYTDVADPECTGPYDNDESSYATGIPGDNSDPYVQDCFFDGDSGGGNDGCRWDTRCTDPPDGQHCNNLQLSGCEKCKPLVPNGCDCFGCCDVYVDGVPHTVRIVDTCTAAVIDNPDLCPPCTKVTECENTCETCEVCIGRPPDPSCGDDAGTGQCPTGIDPCYPPDYYCTSEHKCITGCCQPFLQ